MKFIFFLNYCKFSHLKKKQKKRSDAAAKSDARGDEKHFYFFTWPIYNHFFFSVFFQRRKTAKFEKNRKIMRKIQFWPKNGEKFEFTQNSKQFLKFNSF